MSADNTPLHLNLQFYRSSGMLSNHTFTENTQYELEELSTGSVAEYAAV